MKIIQSLWSKPLSETGGWSEKVFYYMSWALSCLKLKEFYKSIELYTDKKGKELLIDALQLPYDKVHVVLDDINDFSPKLWALGKVYTYSLQEEPFIHVDGDIFIWSKFPDRIENAQLIAQHKEENYEHNKSAAQRLIADGFYFDEEINPKNETEINEVNAGILGGNNIDFFAIYTKEVFDFVKNNKAQIELVEEMGITYVNTIFEQYFFYKLATNNKIDIEYLCLNKISPPFREFVKFESLPYSNTYIHTIAFYKKIFSIGANVAHRLWYEYPNFYYLILKFIENEKE
jgi:hypothetical protein